MKYLLLLSFTLFLFYRAFGQSFYNGDFENTTADTCDYNIRDSVFYQKMPHVFGFGKSYSSGYYIGQLDIQTAGCYVDPQHGHWCIGLASDRVIFTTSDAVALELTSSLVPGNSYQLSFYLYGNLSIPTTTLINLNVGASTTDSDFGVFIDSVFPSANTWKNVIFTFTATEASRYITVKNKTGKGAWNQIDNFTISNTTGTEDALQENAGLELFPNPASGSFVVRSNSDDYDEISVFNTTGALVFKTSIKGSETPVEVADWTKGMYLVRIIDRRGVFCCKKILIE